MSPSTMLRRAAYALLFSSTRAAYVLKQDYDSSNFLNSFQFMTAADYPGTGDPTNGFVNYVSQSKAQSLGLAKVINDQVFLGADNTSKISTSSQGRNSVRLESKVLYDSGLLIADIAHMPGGACGAWPAFWAYNMQENPIGEIDIIEGINNQQENTISLHTCNRCRFTAGSQTGTDLRSDCSMGGDCQEGTVNWDGCGVTASSPASYGDAFNAAGGGVYVTQLEANFIRIWHFARNAIPGDIANGAPDPSKWGKPMGDFQKSNGGCDVGKNFHGLSIIINITFCGDNETDEIWNDDAKCKKLTQGCKSYVANTPNAFSETYWLFNSVRVYQQR